MIRTSGRNASVPVLSGRLSFHVILDDFHWTFSMDGPEGPSGVRLHYEMLRVAREQKEKLRDFDVRAESHEAALAEMRMRFPNSTFLGTWAEARGTRLIGTPINARRPESSGPLDDERGTRDDRTVATTAAGRVTMS